MIHATGYFHRMYDAATGWRGRNMNNWAGGTTCSYSRGTVYAQYDNAAFCEFTPWPGTVYAEFYNTITSHPADNPADFDVEVTLDNGCANMLHYTLDQWG